MAQSTVVPPPYDVDHTRVNEWLLNRRRPVRDLAAPPPGSGLRPVPGDPGLPVIGHGIELLRLGINYAMKRYEQHGPVSWARAFGVNMVSATGPDAAQTVLANKDKAYSQQGWEYFIGPFFTRGLMLLDFEEHLYHRRLMQLAFTAERLSGYLGQVSEVVRSGLDDWAPGTGFPVYRSLKQLTLDVATRVFMASSVGADADRVTSAFVDTVRAGTALVRLPVGRWGAGLRGRRVLEDYFRAALPAKRASDSDDLFAALCHARTDEGETFTDDDVVNHMIFLMMAAHDTSTIATSALVYYLGKHPEWQDRVRAESLAMGDQPLTVEALGQLPALDLVLKESMRLVAPVPWMVRRTVKDTELLGHHVPAGVIVTTLSWVNHMLPEYWSDPLRFDPERFAQDRREDRSHRFAYMPFGGGVHKCIGMHFGTYEVKTLAHELVRRFEWSVPADYHVRWDPMALPLPKDGLPVTLRRR
ncbi:cytochrome P450 [Actinophytocola xinjiangensis]|uniref:Cytochrome P450 n=1 Tax=Actinophytocola xinjiangensis TaxID=485602 RepID=A0A7Z0WRW3_9PSEU|nr:cytochrome P450 [Actinophytocola xinjiangensis]OLF13182.1 cytochrome P450 [Actinophytocola xinjiangensis]